MLLQSKKAQVGIIMKLEKVLAVAMEIGEGMLISGAEVSRVEDTIDRICRAYGAKETDVFSITSSIVTSLKTEEDEILTQTKRIHGYTTDFKRLDEFNTLSRYICKNFPEETYIRQEIDRINAQKVYNLRQKALISAMIAGAFAAFFHGGVEEGITAVLTGAMVTILAAFLRLFSSNTMFINFVSAFFVASCAYLSAKAGFAIDYGKVIIGNIMLLVPGVAFVNSLRDMIGGDMMSGILRLCESVLLTIFLAGGSFASLVFWGGIF